MVDQPTELELLVAEAMRLGDREGIHGPKGHAITEPACNETVRALYLRRARNAIRVLHADIELKQQWDREVADTDRLLYQLGLSPDELRTEGGTLRVNEALRQIRGPAEPFAWLVPFPTGDAYWRKDCDGPLPNTDSHHLRAEPFPLFRRP